MYLLFELLIVALIHYSTVYIHNASFIILPNTPSASTPLARLALSSTNPNVFFFIIRKSVRHGRRGGERGRETPWSRSPRKDNPSRGRRAAHTGAQGGQQQGETSREGLAWGILAAAVDKKQNEIETFLRISQNPSIADPRNGSKCNPSF